MVEIDKQYYYIDIDSINKYIFEEQQDGKKYEEVTYGPKDTVLQRILSDKPTDDKYANIRYDILKSMLDVLYNSGVESEDGNIKYLQDIEDVSIGSKLIFNTLLVKGFIKNKLD